MKRTLVKWWISSAIDQSRDLPPWLKGIIQRDEELERFEKESRWLASELHEQANAWLEAPSCGPETRRPPTVQRDASAVERAARRSAWAIAALAACLFLAVMVGRWLLTGERADRRALVRNADRHALQSDPQALTRLVRASQSMLQPLSRLSDRVSMVALPPPQDWDDRARSLVNRSMDRVYGDLHVSIQRERTRVRNDLKSAVEFFSQSLPRGTARILGLVRG